MDFVAKIQGKRLIKYQDDCSCEWLGRMARQTVGSICCITFLSWCPWSEVGIVDGLVGLINFDWAIGIFWWLCRWPGALIGQLGKRWVNG